MVSHTQHNNEPTLSRSDSSPGCLHLALVYRCHIVDAKGYNNEDILGDGLHNVIVLTPQRGQIKIMYCLHDLMNEQLVESRKWRRYKCSLM